MVLVGHMTIPIRNERNSRVPVDLVVIARDGCTAQSSRTERHCRSLAAVGSPVARNDDWRMRCTAGGQRVVAVAGARTEGGG